MPHITCSAISNSDQVSTSEQAALTKSGVPIYWPPTPPKKFTLEAPGIEPRRSVFESEGGEEPSAGTSSSTSESKQDKSGSSPPETQASLQSPAPVAENPSSADLQASQPSSTASSISGSGQEMPSGQPHPSDSSGMPAGPEAATTPSEETPSAGGFLAG